MKRRLLAFSLIAFLAACGGGGGGGALPSGGGGNGGTGGGGGTSTPTPPPSTSQTAMLGSSPTTFTLGQIASGASATVTMPALASGSASATLTLMSALPSSVPAPSLRRIHHIRPNTLGAAVNAVAYIEVTLTGTVTANQTPAFALTLPAGALSGYEYAALYDPTNAAAGWNAIAGPQGPLGSTDTSVSFPANNVSPAITLVAGVNYYVAIVQNATPLPTPTPVGPAGPPVPGADPTLPPVESTYGNPHSLWSPYDVASSLQFPVQSGWDGAGQTVAIIMSALPSQSDLSTYQTTFQIPTTGRSIQLLNMAAPDGPAGTDAGAIGEVTLDAETVAGLAPGANVSVYGVAQLSTQDFLDTVNYIVSNKAANVISYSAGGCEFSGVTGNSSVFQAAATAGIAVIASAGDQGNECYTGGTPQYQVGAGYPASDPNVVSVGGTETNDQDFNFTLTSTNVWNDNDFGGTNAGQGAGGGGVSANFTIPSYQQGLIGASSSTYRNVPDVALPAEDSANYQGGWESVDGTSWSAPEYAALMAEVDEYCNTTVTTPVTIPYYVYSANASAFIDINQGNNAYASSTPSYTAGTGYDNASGFGVPLGITFANTACPGRTPASGLMARRAWSPMAAAARHASAYAADVTPRAPQLVDMGRRAVDAMTRVQIVIPFTSNAAADESSVVQSLRNAGFTIERTFSNHLIVDAAAPSGLVEQYFSTELHNVLQPHYGTHYMPVREALIPSGLAPHVSGITLDDVVTMRPGLQVNRMPF